MSRFKTGLFLLLTFAVIPAAMFTDQQLELLKKQASASFDYWPYFWLTPLAQLIFAWIMLSVSRLWRPPAPQKIIFGLIFLLVGLFVTFYVPLVFPDTAGICG